ncbi:hypothetical protein [Sporosarcina ureae]|uniref:hypothetical protein n=1 Tax=Sporosarcina ureae TaxID=1571 RepID=UPI000A17E030|nr:hypothetical protein [Sporosarcina ureae]ARK22262.1 hypothetical protein SporoP32a_12435 [Sporosarcina ureae]
MAITYNRQVPIILEIGWHRARVIKVVEGKPVNTMYGLSDTVLITFETEYGGIVSQSFKMLKGTNALLEKLITVTVGEDTGDIDLESLVQLYCGIKVDHNYGKQDRLFVNVVDVCPID